MKRRILTIFVLCAVALAAMAQKPHYLPGDGVYIVGLPADMSDTYDYPVMVTEAYQAKFQTTGAKLASITADKSYNISSRIQSDGTLDMVSFMGCGAATNLTVRNFAGESYTIGDYAPEKTWTTSYLVAGYEPWDGSGKYTLGVYDHWDCPVTYEADAMFTERGMNGLTVDFGNPHEGLVLMGVNFNLLTTSTSVSKMAMGLKVMLTVWDDARENVIAKKLAVLKTNNINKVGVEGDANIYSVYADFGMPQIIDRPFAISVEGLADFGFDAWIPRAVDTHDLYPSHTTYYLGDTTEKVNNSDACINIDAYFNYVGAWGWYDGKEERGEVVSAGDYVQVYIDPSDPDWPGMFFTGDPTFPIECTFGIEDLAVDERPDWISEVSIDSSQWDEYEALLIIMTADAMPSEESGRYGKVVITTMDGASKYTIHIRQGNGSFPDAIDGPVVNLPAEGGMFDLSGRQITQPQPGQVYIKNGKKVVRL